MISDTRFPPTPGLAKVIKRLSRSLAAQEGLWPCGHPRTPENTQSIGVAGVRCRECRRVIALRSHNKRKPAPKRQPKAAE